MIHTDKESACKERVGKHNHEREVGGGLWQAQREEDGIDDQMRVLRAVMYSCGQPNTTTLISHDLDFFEAN